MTFPYAWAPATAPWIQTGLFVLLQLFRFCFSSVCSSLADASCTTLMTMVRVIKDPSVAKHRSLWRLCLTVCKHSHWRFLKCTLLASVTSFFLSLTISVFLVVIVILPSRECTSEFTLCFPSFSLCLNGLAQTSGFLLLADHQFLMFCPSQIHHSGKERWRVTPCAASSR